MVKCVAVGKWLHLRWLDKGVNYIFNANGRCTANVEHSCLDATVRCGSYILGHIYAGHFVYMDGYSGNFPSMGICWCHGRI